ncbi:MAG: hypothetical protein U5N86_01035 [Planctomycetota bacterium]|nr:hypothetical protein [Planctomycetota bacterium]
MDLQKLTTGKARWLTNGADVAIATKVRLARNLSGFHFGDNATASVRTRIVEMVKDLLPQLSETEFPYFFDLRTEPVLTRQVLVERKVISRKFESLTHPRGVGVSKDFSRAILVNSDDHLRLYSTLPSSSIEEVFESADKIDTELSSHMDYAYDDQFGYLTTSLSNVGTGMKTLAVLHLPALSIMNELGKAVRAVRDIGLVIQSFVHNAKGRNSAGHLYSVANTKTLGVSEADIIASLGKYIPHLVSYEQKARDALLGADKRKLMEDKMGRTIGLLKNARMLSIHEAMDNLSILRLGARLDMLPDAAGKLLFDNFFDIQDAHIQAGAGREMSSTEKKSDRADLVRTVLSTVLN